MEKETKRNLIFGIRPILEAINAGKEVDKIFIQNALQGELAGALKKAIREYHIPFQYVPTEKLNRLTNNRNHQGVVGFLSQITYQSIEDILPSVFEEGKTPLLLILDKITDVRNFGAIARTAECSGVQAIIIPSRGSAQINADAIKTSAGALLKIPVCRSENLKQTIAFLKNSGVQIIACTERELPQSRYFHQVNFSLPTAIIMGSEDDGISPEYIKQSDFIAKIPLLGEIDSLNVSVAAGVVLYEAVRQRSI